MMGGKAEPAHQLDFSGALWPARAAMVRLAASPEGRHGAPIRARFPTTGRPRSLEQ